VGASIHDHGDDRDHGGDHRHDHGGHGHSHAPSSFGRAFALGLVLNVGYIVVEAGFGLATNSLALLADAGHNCSDVLGLIAAWAAMAFSRRPPSQRYTYGLRGSTILAALFNSAFLLLTFGAIGWEALMRLFHPSPVAGLTVIFVALAGIVVNGATALLFMSGRKNDLNIRGVFLHMAGDALVSAGVVVAGALILLTGWLWLDPAVSLIVAAIVIVQTWDMTRESIAMSLDAVPAEISTNDVRQYLVAQAGVSEVHDLHIWPMGTTDVAMTAHLVMPAGHPGDMALFRMERGLEERFRINHATLQIELGAMDCPLAPEERV
jgi:cobalt-zinc-cadmium efflux system protein